MKIGFDVISDLNLSQDDSFNWEGKSTSLYCLIAGNISSDLRTVRQTLLHLSKFYQGIFYVAGSLEYEGVDNIDRRTHELQRVCRGVKNSAFLHHHVVIVDGIAIAGANGWYGNTIPVDEDTEKQIEQHRHEDLVYVKSTLEKLQKHLDVKHIIVLSNSVPGLPLYFGEHPVTVENQLSLDLLLPVDTERKISHWIYGTYGKVVDTHINGINYINNSSFKKNPYWAKRIEV